MALEAESGAATKQELSAATKSWKRLEWILPQKLLN